MIDLTDTSTTNQPAIAAFCCENVLGWKWKMALDGPHDGFRFLIMPDARYETAFQCHPDWDGRELEVSIGLISLPNPFNSWADDGAVLVNVRETWGNDESEQYDEARWNAFRWELFDIQLRNKSKSNPMIDDIASYEKGDYCVAACRVIQGEDNAEIQK